MSERVETVIGSLRRQLLQSLELADAIKRAGDPCLMELADLVRDVYRRVATDLTSELRHALQQDAEMRAIIQAAAK